MLQRKSGLKALEKFEDTFRRDHERVTLESEAMRERYEIFVKKEQDAIWVRRLFSPSFIVWLTDTPPKKYAVITSYSIHYTKLYDLVLVPSVLLLIVAALVANSDLLIGPVI